MTGHVFISYSHAGDAAYVSRLADHLTSAGILVWFDRDIITGTRWERVIRDRIDTCAAFVVVMTPQAEESEWISLEINRAALKQRPILPLLLDGTVFFRLSTVQHENVTGDVMPSAAFLSRLRAHQNPVPPTPLPETKPAIRPPSPLVPPTPTATSSTAELRMWERFSALRKEARKASQGGDHTEAARLYREIVADAAQLGHDHPLSLDARANLAYQVGESGDRAEAIRLLLGLIADRTRTQGADRRETLSARHHHARNVGESGDRAEAVRLLRGLIADRERYATFPGFMDPGKESDKQWLKYFGG